MDSRFNLRVHFIDSCFNKRVDWWTLALLRGLTGGLSLYEEGWLVDSCFIKRIDWWTLALLRRLTGGLSLY